MANPEVVAETKDAHVVDVKLDETIKTDTKATATESSSPPSSSSSVGPGYGLSISSLATYMPTGTIAAFVVLTQLVADGGQCKHTTNGAGNFLKAHDRAEVTMMALVIWLLGLLCFVSSFLKTKADPHVPGHVTYSFVSQNQLIGNRKKDKEGNQSDALNPDGETLKWCAGWKLWVHAIFSTLAYATWSLTSTSATSCFYSLPNAVSRSLSPIMALICAIAFSFLGPPTTEDQVSIFSVFNNQESKVQATVTETIQDTHDPSKEGVNNLSNPKPGPQSEVK